MQFVKQSFPNVLISSIIEIVQKNKALSDGFTLLDSSQFDDENETSYVCMKPKHVYEMRGDRVYIDNVCIGSGKACLYEAMRALLKQYEDDYENESGFVGGFVGYISYEATPLFLGVDVQSTLTTPCICFRFYTQVLRIKRGEAELFLLEGEAFSEWNDFVKSDQEEIVVSTFADAMAEEAMYQNSMPEELFVRGVESTKAEIEAGMVYQLNLTRRLRRQIEQNNAFLTNYYAHIRKRNKAPFAMLWLDDVEQLQFASSSPERFFQIDKQVIRTMPIKGTRPRKSDPIKDAQMYRELEHSEKDRAELLMITDLLRNDLNCVVENNTVEVLEFAAVKANPTVFHLVSTIQAKLPNTKDVFDVFDGLFPGGSITGAPKRAAVEYIDCFETCGRGLYTGSAGYISVNNDADFNILIRTLFQKHDTIDVHVGGGIVYESVPNLEYLETKQKAKAILKVVEDVLE